ncbi:acetyltransferase (GNAT) family protein [Stackebrandtia albiflava]|uniref:Acetyltransferase (GNAT) family protein n=1 Tax=Stackebrandtia albiflava TaxID=406432 RepID=A0A562VE56_9ACTN|nr:GNAT family N-acetyltransferase [Stackebrandtia albiflava]TWJ16097.1 acetyltransferase (GNAT) family protein [Stackebrandtia albiflava]
MDFVTVDPTTELWDEVYRELLRPSFPDNELSPADVLAQRLQHETAAATAAVDPDSGKPVAVALGEWSERSRVQLLSYLAVSRGQRGTGIGGRLLTAVREDWRERFRPCAVLAEVEHPSDHDGSRAHGDPDARVRFYERQGAKALELPHFQPALSEATPRTYGMLLLCLDLDSALRGPEPGTMDPSALHEFLAEYLRENEGEVGDDKPTKALFKALDRESGIPLRPLSEIESIPRSAKP